MPWSRLRALAAAATKGLGAGRQALFSRLEPYGKPSGEGASDFPEAFAAATQAVKFFALLYCFDQYVLHVTAVYGPSMMPTLHLSGDIVVVDRIVWDPIRRGDIVTAASPNRRNFEVCKRVIGLPGDTIHQRSGAHSLVPPGHVWLEGDNPHYSNDSRAYGPVPAALLRGRVIGRVWPPSSACWVRRGEARPTANTELLRAMSEDPVTRASAQAAVEARAAEAAAEAAAAAVAAQMEAAAQEAALSAAAAAAITAAEVGARSTAAA